MIKAEIMHTGYFAQQYSFAAPCPALLPYVDYYWQLDLRQNTLAAEYYEQIFANLNASLVFNLGSPFGVKNAAGSTEHTFAKSIVVGQRNQPVVYRHVHGNFLLGIKFKPAGLSALLNIDAHELNNGFVLAEELAKTNGLEERLNVQAQFLSRTSCLEAFLLDLRAKNTPGQYRYHYLAQALQYLQQKQGGYTVQQLADVLCLTPKTLSRYFAHSVGLNPKTSARIIRFRKALPYYAAHGSAYSYEELGYTDFSHFMKDYRSFAYKVTEE